MGPARGQHSKWRYPGSVAEEMKMGWVQTTIRTLFAFNGFVILLFLQFFILERVESRSWLFGVLLAAAWASLVWVLYRESRLPLSPATIVGHAVWVLSALGYIWLGDDPLLTYTDHVGLDFSKPTDFEKVERFQLMRTSVYVLLSTTGLAWLQRAVARKRPDASQAQSYSRMSGLLMGSICALLVSIVFFAAVASGVLLEFIVMSQGVLGLLASPIVIVALYLFALLLAAIEVARGNQMAFRVGVAVMLSPFFPVSLAN